MVKEQRKRKNICISSVDILGEAFKSSALAGSIKYAITTITTVVTTKTTGAVNSRARESPVFISVPPSWSMFQA